MLFVYGVLVDEVSLVFFLLMVRPPPRSTRTDTLFPYTSRFRSHQRGDRAGLAGGVDHQQHRPAGAPCQRRGRAVVDRAGRRRSEEHTSELQSLMRKSYAVYCLKNKNNRATADYKINIT